ncbi:MAG: hypothetical protein ACFBSF_01860 [Leptolyngbyaceae cyanobacterium]
MTPSDAPSPNSAISPSNPDHASAEFLGLNLDVFREVVAFAQVAEGFTYAIAEINFASDGDLLVQALQNHAVAQEVRLIELDFTDQASLSLLSAVKEQLAALKIAAADNPVLLVRGLATAIGVKGNYPNFLTDLNFKRDVLAAQVPYPMVLFLPDYAVDRLARYAQDFWTWRSGHLRFRTLRQTVETAQTQLAQPVPTQPADSRPVKQNRID